MPDEKRPTVKIPIEIAELISEINAADPEAFPPNDKKTYSEKLILTLDDNFVKKVWSAMSFYRRESSHAAVDAQWDKKSITTAARLEQKADLLNQIFWWLVRKKSACDIPMTIGIREGWQIVETSPPDAMENIRKLLGGVS